MEASSSAPDDTAALTAARALPLADRVAHKLWKARCDAYDAIKTGAEAGDAPPDVGELLVRAAGDANAAALDRALDAACAWLTAASVTDATRCVREEGGGGGCAHRARARPAPLEHDEAGPAPAVERVPTHDAPHTHTHTHTHRLAPYLAPALSKKALKGRPATVARATEALVLLAGGGGGADVATSLVEASKDRIPKVAAASVEAARSVLAAYGPSCLPPAPLLAALPSLLASKSGDVRDSAKQLAGELGGWIGAAAVRASVASVGDAAKKDVEALLASGAPPPAPARKTKAQADAEAAAAAASMDVDGGEDAVVTAPAAAPPPPLTVDPYAILPPADVSASLGRPFHTALGSAKWSDRRDALRAAAEAAAAAPRLAVTPAWDGALRAARAVLATDANAACVAEAAALVAALANGGRRDLGGSARPLVAPLLAKLKDKQATVRARAADALAAVLTRCVPPADVADDLVAAAGHANPVAREAALRVLARVAGGSDGGGASKTLAAVGGAVAAAAGAPTPAVRAAASAALAALAAAAGPAGARALAALPLDDKARARVAAAGQEVASGDATAVASPPSLPQPARGPLAPRPTNGTAPVGRVTVPVAKPVAAKPAARPAARPAPVAKPQPASTVAADDGTLPSPLSTAEAQDALSSLIGADGVAGLTSKVWKERLAAADAVVEAVGASTSPPATTLLPALCVLPGWIDPVAQVVGRTLAAVTTVARAAPHLPRDAIAGAAAGAADRLADVKLKAAAGEALSALAEASSPTVVTAIVAARGRAAKSPKVAAEGVAWAAAAVDAFGVASFHVPSLLDWWLAATDVPSPDVRKAAVAALATLHAHAGGAVAAAAKARVKPALAASLDATFAARPGPPQAPTLTVKTVCGGGGVSGVYTAVATPAADNNTNVTATASPLPPPPPALPRASISAAITPALLARFDAPAWQDRNAALADVEDAVAAAGGRVRGGADLGGLPSGLRARLADTNANLVARALHVAAVVAAAAGDEWEPAGGCLRAPAIALLADKKAAVRAGAGRLLTAWLDAAPTRVLAAVCEAAVVARPGDARAATLAWVASVAPRAAATAPRDALAAAGAGLADKSAAARSAAVTIVHAVVAELGPDRAAAAAAGVEPRDALAAALKKAGVAAAVDDARRAVAPRAARAVRSTAPPPSAVEPEPTPPLLADARATKDARLARLRARAGGPPPQPSEELAALRRDLGPLLPADACKRLLDGDAAAAADVASCLATLADGGDADGVVLGGADLLLRWCAATARDALAPPTLAAAAARLAISVLAAFQRRGAPLSSAEAGALLPAVVEGAGSTHARARAGWQAVLDAALPVAPPSRLLDAATGALTCRTARVRAEGLALAAEAARAGAARGARGAPFAPVAALAADRDPGTRAAALAALAALVDAEGADAAWRAVGPLAGAARAAVASVFDEAAASPAAGTPARPQASFDDARTPALPATVARTPAPPHSHTPAPPASLARTPGPPLAHTPAPPPTTARPALTTPFPAVTPGGLAAVTPAPPRSAAAAADAVAAWAAGVTDLASPDLGVATEGMKALCYELIDAAGGAAPADALAAMAADADGVVAALAARAAPAFDAALCTNSDTRPAKYVLNAVMHAFAVPCVARAVSAPTVRALSSSLLVRLLDGSLDAVPDGGMLLRAVNVAMLRVVQCGSPRATLPALVRLLQVPPPSVVAAGDAARARFDELAAKCLSKATKALQAEGGGGGGGDAACANLDASATLAAVASLLDALGPDAVRRRGAGDDPSLRAVKALVHELCKARGHAVRADAVAAHVPTGHLLASYIDLNLATLAGAGVIGAPPGDAAEAAAAAAEAEGAAQLPAPAAATAGAEAKAKLATIFRLIGCKATSEAGLDALAAFARAHPTLDLGPHLAKTSDHFRAYVARGVARANARFEAGVSGGAGVAAAAATPPPAAAHPSLDELRARVEAVRLTAAAGPPPPPAAASGSASLAALRERVASLKRGAKAARRE